MKIIHARTLMEAYQEAQRQKTMPENAECVFKVVRSRYEDNHFDILIMDPDTFTDMMTGEIPRIPQLNNRIRSVGELV